MNLFGRAFRGTGSWSAAAGVTVSGATVTNGTVNPPLPCAPTQLTATAMSATEVDLTWKETGTNQTGFVVQRAPAGTGADGGTTQAVYGAPLLLIKGTFSTGTPTFTDTAGDVCNVFIDRSSYTTEAATIVFSCGYLT